jgi:hypothetical protein
LEKKKSQLTFLTGSFGQNYFIPSHDYKLTAPAWKDVTTKKKISR